MISIYLCDDEESVRHQLKTALEWKIFVENYDMKVVCAASTAQALLDAAQDSRRGVYFLDVDLKDGAWDGFTLGRELRRRDPHGTLVYITSYGDLAWKTFQYHLEAFDYIVKEGEQTGPAEMFSLRTGDEPRHIPLADILFFEAAPKAHHVYLHTADSRLDFVGSLNELEKELDGRFVRVHRSFLAALDKIETVDGKGNQVRVGGRICLLSRTGKAELKKKLRGSF